MKLYKVQDWMLPTLFLLFNKNGEFVFVRKGDSSRTIKLLFDKDRQKLPIDRTTWSSDEKWIAFCCNVAETRLSKLVGIYESV